MTLTFERMLKGRAYCASPVHGTRDPIGTSPVRIVGVPELPGE
jgi:hypothetical protein